MTSLRSWFLSLAVCLIATSAVGQETTPAVEPKAPAATEPKTEPKTEPAVKAEDAPKTDAPKTDAPKTDAPKTDAPKTDAPKTDAPKTDAPKTDAPKTDAPKTDAPKTDAPKTDAPATETKPVESAETAEFAKAFADWKQLLGELRSLRLKYRTLEKEEEKKAAADTYEQLIARGEELEPKVAAAAQKAYEADPKHQLDAERFLASVAQLEFDADQYEKAIPVAKLLIEKGYQNASIYRILGLAAFYTSDYDTALKYLKLAEENNALDAQTKAQMPDVTIAVNEAKANWEKEQAIRKTEDEKGDLPRVELTTTKGKIVIELFENEAPNTVANFIQLVEKGFYNKLKFHRVLSGFMAQGGCPTGDGTGDPGYRFADELEPGKYRRHFRGSLSMANSGPNTNGSQFFLTFRPTDFLNGKHTVFGRVVEGMDIAAALERIDPQNPSARLKPDEIVEAKVLRKREHPYEVQKLEK